jgi:hypothetical protein
MKFFQALAFLVTLVTVDAFQPAFVGRAPIALFTVNDFSAVGSGMTEDQIPLLIENFSKDNFQLSLEMLEPLLTVECVGDHCDTYVAELRAKAAEIGMELPAGYAPSHH